MSNFVLARAAVITAYNAFITAGVNLAAAQATLTGLGARPSKPLDVTTDAIWNNYVTAVEAYDASYTTAAADVTTYTTQVRVTELAVIATLGYNTNNDPRSICLDQWVMVNNTGGGALTYTNYIGASITSTYLKILSSPPTQPWPLF